MKQIRLFLSLSMTWNRQMIPGVARYAREQGDWQLRVWEKLTEDIFLQPCDGVIGIFSTKEEALARKLLAKGIPLIGVAGFQPLPFLPLVCHDDIAIGRMAAEHLLAKGLRDFAVITVRTGVNHTMRAEGFCKVLQERGMAAPPVLDGDTQQIAKDLRSLARPCGVFAVNDQRARHFEEAAQKNGMRIPGDFAVIGVDNDSVHCELSPVPLSSVKLQFEEIGWRAAASLDKLMRGKQIPQIEMLPPVDVEVRNSTEQLLVEDPLIRRTLALMKQNLANANGIAGFAQELGISRRHLEYRFRAATGNTLHRELRNLRMETARQMLLSKPLRIQEIAEAVGCPDINRFSTYFRKAYGVSPSAYRKANS